MSNTKARRAATGDRGPPEGSPEIYTVDQIGPKRARTPNGNLICYDVPIARTGVLLYKAGEVPLKPGRDGIIRVTRTAEELFRPETIGSCMGAAVTDEHPEEMEVTPRTWKRYALGFSTTNVRRGEGEDSEVLLADLIITDKTLIEQVESGKVEVSLGYDAEYEQTGDGEGLQTDIIGNHIAVVTRGRCGPRCAIGDHDPFTKGNTMATRKRLTTADALKRMRAIVGDAEALLEETADPSMAEEGADPAGGTHIHIHTNGSSGQGDPDDMNPGNMPKTVATDEDPNAGAPDGGQPDAAGDIGARVAALETGMKQIAGTMSELVALVKGGGEKPPVPGGDADPDEEDPDGDPTKDEFPEDLKNKGDDTTKDELPEEFKEKQKTGDSAALSKSYQQLLSDAEVLVPGFRAPTFDAKANRAKTVDRMCSLRRKALDAFYMTTPGKQVVDTLTGKSDIVLEDMACAPLAQLFKSAAGATRLVNNRSATGDAGTLPGKVEAPKPLGITDLNKQNQEFWAKQGITR